MSGFGEKLQIIVVNQGKDGTVCIKDKMHSHRTKWKSRQCSHPHIEVNTLWRKPPAKVGPARKMEKSKKAEANDPPPHPVGDHQDTSEKKRLGPITEVKKKNTAKTMAKKIMSKTFPG